MTPTSPSAGVAATLRDYAMQHGEPDDFMEAIRTVEALADEARNAAAIIRNCVSAGQIGAGYAQHADDIDARLAALGGAAPAKEGEDGVDLCEVAKELERVHAAHVIAEVAALAGDRTDAYWSGHSLACEEIAHRLGLQLPSTPAAPKGGEDEAWKIDRHDRFQKYAQELGYAGIAHALSSTPRHSHIPQMYAAAPAGDGEMQFVGIVVEEPSGGLAISKSAAPKGGEDSWTEDRLRDEAKRRGWYVRDSASIPTEDGYTHPFQVTIPSRDLLALLPATPAGGGDGLASIIADIRHSALVDDYEPQQIAFLESIASRLASTGSAPDIDTMVSRFLAWRLPDDFAPDAGISFTPITNPAWTHDTWPTGTNLLHAEQARALFEHCLAGGGAR